ncbi:FLORAL FUSED ORGANS 3, CHROMATIN REMODELING 2, ARABIDOPSIS THALIANA BRAHMA, BRAHMA [Hibiscus trionum]|uniref:FLORAL FUSED ORGANS 3, CHROMATIN REMODELING 2, ARABIDOPSIS THALIANA BRAHMA, BRAHMA n=1 Tax=Hibiscus trionum TaxID=183268 RepID=A0A9W7GWF2_HIBTR|nr:FLORAL FUSED ORGANS 3, CHROMATIN REMODELING 2, ARABIDOPSIS THALIANA BRAHMA, BRAHMA [Hibiscus trionum]
MQSGGGGGGGPSRNPGVGPVGRTAPTSSAASPTSSSSAVSAPHFGRDSAQQQQQQQIASRQSLQQQLFRKPEGNDAILAYQASGLQGMMGGSNFPSSPGSMQPPQQSRKFFDLAQQHASAQEGQHRNQGIEQQMLNPFQQAYYQYAYKASQQQNTLLAQQQAKTTMLGSVSAKDQDMRIGNLKMQELISMQGAKQASSSKNTSEQLGRVEKQMEQGQVSASEHRHELKAPAQASVSGKSMPLNVLRAMQAQQAQQTVQNTGNNQLVMAAQLQAWALEHNIDLSQPANANLMAQLIPLMQSKMAAQQKANEINMASQSSPMHVSKQQVSSPSVPSESSLRGNSSNDISAQSGPAKTRQTSIPIPFCSTSSSGVVNNANNIAMQQLAIHGRDNQVPPRQTVLHGNGMPLTHPPQSSANITQSADPSLPAKKSLGGTGIPQTQYIKQSNRSPPLPAAPNNDGVSVNNSPSQAGTATKIPQQHSGFTKQQLHVLKAQILAFRRIKKGDRTLPPELLRAIVPPPLELQQLPFPPLGGKSIEDQVNHLESKEKVLQAGPSTNGQNATKEEAYAGDDKATASIAHMQGVSATAKEFSSTLPAGKEEQQSSVFPAKSDREVERGLPKTPITSDFSAERGKTVAPEVAASDGQIKKPTEVNTDPHLKDLGSARMYHGPLFDFPFFTRKHDSYGSAMPNGNNNLTLAYDVKDLLFEEGIEVLSKKRSENLRKIGGLLAVNLERKRIRPDLVLRLQIEEKKLQFIDLQARLRDEVDQQQQEIMVMPDRPYRKFVRLCERQRMELARQVQATQKALRDKQLKSIFQWRKKLLEAHWAIRDARTARNRGVAKYHEKMLREFSKRKDDDRTKRMEALKNNDVERYREMLIEQQTSMTGAAAERYEVLSSFLTQTEEYLHKLGSKITSAKNQQEVDEAANAAAVAARLQGLSEEEVRVAAACAGEEVMIRNRFMEMNAPKDDSSVSKYYNLAHAVNERVITQPSMLRAGTLRDYQLVGLQWMLSLYNNKLNGILADEMGLGKTVQVMALIAYLMEFKGNYGPHLIIVPNAVLVNWKSELHNWLPSVSCIYYVGGKDQRSKLFSQEVLAMKFNVLVTTYEFIMYDRSKLSKIDWKYIIIDEAQRMKDRESVLARDLDRYRCQRRLLLTGTPLQNDLKELWSLLNLLLPEVFDNRKAFHDWFSQPFQKEGPMHNAEDDWLETEKKVIIIHRLHQILEPFMLRRRVEDVEGSLPPKVSIVLKCRMSAIQSAIYDWIKSTGTLRVDPEDEKLKVQKNPLYQARVYKVLNNRCMELRKTCNHPLLNYPFFNDLSKEFLIKSCGKLWILDRILIKLQRTGHRVLLFSTMTKLLDILEEYLQWRRLVYRRIDGTTSLEDRESAIVDFNSPGSECFIFLLSIRAAGRGLNLQSADTVVIYDPDPNPKNEEQAVARAHRIGQTREVKVIYMEAVVDKISSQQKEDELRSQGTVDVEDDFAGKDRYMGSIESLIRNNIQQYKIEMADEVINAGRFDQRTTHEERRMTLETLLHDEERYQETVHDIPSLHQVNCMIARSEEEVELFDQMDEELDWIEEMTCHEQVPKWLRASTREVNTTVATLSKKPSKNILFTAGVVGVSNEMETERKRGRPKGKKRLNYKEIDDENGEYSEVSSDERNDYSANDEEGETGEFEEDEFSGAVGAPPVNKDQSEEDGPLGDNGYEYDHTSEHIRNNHILEEAGSSGSSLDCRRPPQMVSPVSPQKFGSLSALDARPSSVARRPHDELEEGEIAISRDSHMNHQQSESWIHDREEGEDEQVVQPKMKRKRSIRVRPRHTVERAEKSVTGVSHLQRRESSLLSSQLDHKYQSQLRIDTETKPTRERNAFRHDPNDSSSKTKRNLPSRKISNTSKLHASPKSGRVNMAATLENVGEPSRENRDSKLVNTSGSPNFAVKMSDVIQRKCKNVISKLQRRIDKEGQQIIPLLTDLWKRIESSGYMGGSRSTHLDLWKIDQRVDRLEYSGVMELVSDVQLVLKSAMQFYGFSHEVRSEARKVHDLFFDLLKIAFPDTDFREARNALAFSGPVSTSASGPSARQVAVSKKQKSINEVESDSSLTQKTLQRGSTHAGEDTRVKVHMPQKESRLGKGSSITREQYHHNDDSLLTHPGELVICKKKRKDREKSTVKPRSGSVGPVSPPSIGRNIRSPGAGSVSKDARPTQQATRQQGLPNQLGHPSNSSGGIVGWANPVKKLRTDFGKRRPAFNDNL